MKHGIRIVCITLICLIGSLFICLPALAVPQIPASFYGTVKVNGANVPDGTSVQALIDGKVYADVLTQTYQGELGLCAECDRRRHRHPGEGWRP